MQKKTLNVAAALLTVISEIWLLRLCGEKSWSDIIFVIIIFAIPIGWLPWKLFRMWLGYIFGEYDGVKQNAQSGSGETRSQTEAAKEAAEAVRRQKEAERARSDAEMRARREKAEREVLEKAEKTRKTFLYFLSALAAKVAKADGHVDATEIAAVERAFERLGLSHEHRRYCIGVFRETLASKVLTLEIVNDLAASSLSHEMKAVVYDVLWDVACADGVLTRGEKDVLLLVSDELKLNSYGRYYKQRIHEKTNSDASDGNGRNDGKSRMTLDDAYELLGCVPCNSDSDVKSAYREMAKKHHPDALRAQGLPDEMIDVATRKMAEINAAWEMIKDSRHL